MERSTCSHQLRLLRNLGLANAERHGRSIVYSLYDIHVADLLDQATRSAVQDGHVVMLPFDRQLRLHLTGLGQREAFSLPSGRVAVGSRAVVPPRRREVADDQWVLPPVAHGQLTLLPGRRSLGRDESLRIAGRRWPEEEVPRQRPGR